MKIYNSLKNKALLPWFTIGIDVVGDSKFIYLFSKIHKLPPNGKKLTFCFSLEFSDYDILNDADVYKAMVGNFGNRLFKE